jgi:hypothetical protein
MNILEIRRIAGQLGINPAGMEKADLVRAIQRAEGVNDCFGSAVSEECDEECCLWREECFFESVAREEAV